MQVLVKNPHSTSIQPTNVSESFWSSECLYLGSAFSMTSLMDLNNPLGLSPFLVLDSKIAFFIAQLEKSITLATKNLGPLGTVGAHIFSNAKLSHNEDPKKVSRYAKEYFPTSPIAAAATEVDQVIVYNESVIDQELWKKLKVGGVYLLASIKAPLELKASENFQALEHKFPYGMSTEFGWRFFEEEWGLDLFEFAKLKKLS